MSTAAIVLSSHSSSSKKIISPPSDGQYYVVSRNGILMSWKQIHKQYRRIDDDMAIDSSSLSSCNNNNNTPLNSNSLLQLLPRGAYTTCRTVKGGTYIYQFDYHVKRLADSAKSILELQLQQQLQATSIVTNHHEQQQQEQLGGNDADGDNNCEITSLTASNHPIQHDRTLSAFEIEKLNITNVAWEHNMALKCIRQTLSEFCDCYGLKKQQQAYSRGEVRGDDGGVVDDNRMNDDGLKNDEGDKDENDAEFKITLLATWEKKNSNDEGIKSLATTHNSSSSYQSVLYCHVGLLKTPPPSSQGSSNIDITSRNKSPHVRVLIHGHGRKNALAKDSAWVFDREKLTYIEDDNQEKESDNNNIDMEDSSRQPFEEVILINDDGELLEGTQTNFYVVSSQNPNSIITANEGILYGSVRDSVLRACKHHNIPVELRPPTLHDLKDACGVFLTSTSRWVMPVDEVCLGDLIKKTDGKKSYFYENCKTTESIRRWVLEDVESHSTSIY